MSDRETIAVYDARADDYANLGPSSGDRPRLRDFIDRLPEGGKVLDLGCGPGGSSVPMAEAEMDVLAWDASAEMIKLAARDPRITAEQRVFDDLSELAADSLDGVWANFSLLHAPRAALPGHLAAIANALRPGGHFLIAVKTGEGEERDSIGRLYTYFTQEELRWLLADTGFTVLRDDRGRDKGLSGEDADWVSLTCQLETTP